MINMYRWKQPHLTVRCVTAGFVEDGLLRTHLPMMFPLVKNGSQGIEDDQTLS